MQPPVHPAWQPELTPLRQTWRTALAVAISAMAWGVVLPAQWEHHRLLFWVDVVLGSLAWILVWFRRRWPMPIAVLATICTAASGLAAGPSTLAAISMATRRIVWQIATLAGIALVSAQFFSATQPTPDDDPYWLVLTVNSVVIAASLAWGMYVGSRRELLWTLRDRAERAEAEQELRAQKARGDERARIAREMHDVLAHRISHVSMHAGAMAFREDLSAEALRNSAAVVQEQANQALTELRAVLGVLRDQDTGELLEQPQPTLNDLPTLLAESRDAGLSVEYTESLDRVEPTIDERVGRTIYRIIQEGLTNARKHAPGTTVFVEVAGGPDDGVEVTVRNPVGFGTPPPPGAGLGLVGLAERAALHGGRLNAAQDGAAFTLHVWIPWAS